MDTLGPAKISNAEEKANLASSIEFAWREEAFSQMWINSLRRKISGEELC